MFTFNILETVAQSRQKTQFDKNQYWRFRMILKSFENFDHFY